MNIFERNRKEFDEIIKLMGFIHLVRDISELGYEEASKYLMDFEREYIVTIKDYDANQLVQERKRLINLVYEIRRSVK